MEKVIVMHQNSGGIAFYNWFAYVLDLPPLVIKGHKSD